MTTLTAATQMRKIMSKNTVNHHDEFYITYCNSSEIGKKIVDKVLLLLLQFFFLKLFLR